MNLAQRLSLTHSFIALLAVVITLTVMIGGAHHFFWNEIHVSQQRQMDDFALAVRETYFTHEDMSTLNFMRSAAKQETVAFTSFKSADGKDHLVLPTTYQDVDVSAGDWTLHGGLRVNVLSNTVSTGGNPIGTVMIAYDSGKLEDRVQTQVNHWMVLGAIAGLSALLIALATSILLSKNLVKPIKSIRVGTEQVRLGKLNKLVEVDRSDEIGALARDFNAMVVQLKELEIMKRDFISGVTHDFGTPLHAIKTALEILEEKQAGPLTDKQAEYLLMISNNTLQLTSFIHNLLTLARIEAAKAEPYYETIDVLALTREIVDLYRPQAEKLGLRLNLINDEASLTLVTDMTMFRQIVTNLVSNAMKFTLKGEVNVTLFKENSFFTFKITDTGIGIDQEHLDLIFDRFFRVRQPKNFPPRQGSGLGLAIAKGLVESMGGSILVQSQSGVGSTFTVKIPLNFNPPKGEKNV